MKISGTSILWLLLGIASLLLLASGSSTTSLRISEVFSDSSILSTVAATGRKLQGSSCSPSADGRIDGEDMHLEDYRQPIDPLPNWKASIRPGPIQHGNPLNPYIPKLPPPPTSDHPKVGGSS